MHTTQEDIRRLGPPQYKGKVNMVKRKERKKRNSTIPDSGMHGGFLCLYKAEHSSA